MTDIVERLRDIRKGQITQDGTYLSVADLCKQAADEIERLRGLFSDLANEMRKDRPDYLTCAGIVATALAGGESKRPYTRADYDAAPEDGAGREPSARP